MSILGNPKGWPPDFSARVFLARALTALPPDIVWAALKSGELAAYTYSTEATKFTPVSPEAFRDTDRAQVFETCRIGSHWLYVIRASLASLRLTNDPSLIEAALVREAEKRPNLLRAIEFIRRETNASIGAAQELLVTACAAGKVRAWRREVRAWRREVRAWRVNDSFQKERIPPQTWRDAMIDKDKLITAVSSERPRTVQGRMVVISLEDLRHHLGTLTKENAVKTAPVELPAPAPPPVPTAPEPIETDDSEQPKKQRGSTASASSRDVKSVQRESIAAAVKALWNDKVPSGTHTRDRNDKIQDWQKKNGRAVASEKTIDRYFKQS
jgi:hypothetical protein